MLRVLAFGDSLTAGYSGYGAVMHPYSKILKQQIEVIRPCAVETAGVCGEITQEMADRLPIILKKHEPFDWIALLGGSNDLAFVNEDEIVSNIEILHRTAHDAKAKSLLLTIPPSLKSVKSFEAKRISVNKRLRSFSKQNADKVVLVELQDSSRIPTKSADLTKDVWDQDGVHFKPRGYDEIGLIVFEALLPHIKN